MTTPLAPYRLIFNPSPKLWITPSRFKEWTDELAARQGIIIWNRDGMVRVIPHTVLCNALQAYSDHAELRSRGKILEIPIESQYIHWDQAIAVNPLTYQPIKPA